MQAILQQIHTEAQALFGRGHVASYIPALAQVPPRQFGMAVAQIDGSTHAVGDAHTPFSLQSITKLFTFVLALKLVLDNYCRQCAIEMSCSQLAQAHRLAPRLTARVSTGPGV